MTSALPGPRWLRNLVLGAAGMLLVVAAVSVLTAGSAARQAPLQRARPFTLAAVGDPARSISLANYAGRPVIINFFASWCVPCRRETPLLARFYRAHNGRALIIGIDANDKSAAAMKFLHAEGVSYPVAADPSLAVTLSYGLGATGIPQSFFLNAKHQIVKHIFGDVTLSELNSWLSTIAPHRIGAS